jgi:hypothetical protein
MPKSYLVCGADSCWFDRAQKLTLVDSMIVHGPLGCLLLSVIIPCRGSKPIVRLVNFRLAYESTQLKPCSLGEAYLRLIWLVDVLFYIAILPWIMPLRSGISQARITNRKRVPIRLARWFHSWLPSEQDGVLLEIRNWNEESYGWSLVATTSLNLAIMSLPRGQTLLDTSITMFVPSPFVVA